MDPDDDNGNKDKDVPSRETTPSLSDLEHDEDEDYAESQSSSASESDQPAPLLPASAKRVRIGSTESINFAMSEIKAQANGYDNTPDTAGASANANSASGHDNDQEQDSSDEEPLPLTIDERTDSPAPVIEELSQGTSGPASPTPLYTITSRDPSPEKIDHSNKPVAIKVEKLEDNFTRGKDCLSQPANQAELDEMMRNLRVLTERVLQTQQELDAKLLQAKENDLQAVELYKDVLGDIPSPAVASSADDAVMELPQTTKPITKTVRKAAQKANEQMKKPLPSIKQSPKKGPISSRPKRHYDMANRDKKKRPSAVMMGSDSEPDTEPNSKRSMPYVPRKKPYNLTPEGSENSQTSAKLRPRIGGKFVSTDNIDAASRDTLPEETHSEPIRQTKKTSGKPRYRPSMVKPLNGIPKKKRLVLKVQQTPQEEKTTLLADYNVRIGQLGRKISQEYARFRRKNQYSEPALTALTTRVTALETTRIELENQIEAVQEELTQMAAESGDMQHHEPTIQQAHQVRECSPEIPHPNQAVKEPKALSEDGPSNKSQNVGRDNESASSSESESESDPQNIILVPRLEYLRIQVQRNVKEGTADRICIPMPLRRPFVRVQRDNYKILWGHDFPSNEPANDPTQEKNPEASPEMADEVAEKPEQAKPTAKKRLKLRDEIHKYSRECVRGYLANKPASYKQQFANSIPVSERERLGIDSSGCQLVKSVQKPTIPEQSLNQDSQKELPGKAKETSRRANKDLGQAPLRPPGPRTEVGKTEPAPIVKDAPTNVAEVQVTIRNAMTRPTDANKSCRSGMVQKEAASPTKEKPGKRSAAPTAKKTVMSATTALAISDNEKKVKRRKEVANVVRSSLNKPSTSQDTDGNNGEKNGASSNPGKATASGTAPTQPNAHQVLMDRLQRIRTAIVEMEKANQETTPTGIFMYTGSLDRDRNAWCPKVADMRQFLQQASDCYLIIKLVDKDDKETYTAPKKSKTPMADNSQEWGLVVRQAVSWVNLHHGVSVQDIREYARAARNMGSLTDNAIENHVREELARLLGSDKVVDIEGGKYLPTATFHDD